MIARQWCAVLTLTSSVAGAAEWTVSPQISVSADYQDNPQLILKDAQEVGVVSLDARAVLAASAESAQLSATPRVHATRYPDYAEFDNDSQGLALSYQYESERSLWSVAGDTARDSTVTTELEDTGFVQARKWRSSSSFNPAWSGELLDGFIGKLMNSFAGMTIITFVYILVLVLETHFKIDW